MEEAPVVGAVVNSGAIHDMATSIQQTSTHALEALQVGATDAHSASVPLADGMCHHAVCPSSTSRIIGDLASVLDAKLAYVQHLDPDSTNTISDSMALIVDSLREALEPGSTTPVAEQAAQGIGAYLQNLTFQLQEAQSSAIVTQVLHSFVPPLGAGSQGANPDSNCVRRMNFEVGC